MIVDFKCKETEKIFQRIFSKKFSKDLSRIAYRKLLILYASTDINDLRIPPSNYLEKLKGDRKGQYSIRANQQWRICFIWKDGHAYQVSLEDYHS
jgi:proteic killer suppression protein